MTQIALASGFGCVRRFNAGIRKVYHRTPTQIRRISRQTQGQPENQYLFRLRYRPPYDWKGMLAFLAARATPGVEIVEGGSYRRSISLNNNHGYFEVSLDDANHALLARVQFADPRSLFFITERIRSMFDLNADWSAIATTLSLDAALAVRMEAEPGLRVPGCWNGFELAVRAILGQQVSVKGATTLAGRLAKTFGQPFPGTAGLTHIFPSPQTLAGAAIASIGLPSARADTVRALARAVCDGRISFDSVLDSNDFLVHLCEIPGIGNWTAQYIAMRALGEPDAFPTTDLGLLRALQITSPRELERRAEAWRPWRAYAAVHLWNMAGRSTNPGMTKSTTSSPSVFAMVATPA
jgi:AraC family transcriptional regulator of adaptative response / DNA-3-methyladenine glycosylase II